jgi:hypothetical protein
MSRTGLAGLTVVALIAVGVIAAPAAGAAPTTTSCSATSLVRPLLGAPTCTTLPQVCPAGATECGATAKLAAARLVGLGTTTAKVTVFDADNPTVSIDETCSGANQCTRELAGIRVVEDLRYAARCEWTGTTLGVLAKVDCSLTQNSVGPQ